MKLFDIMSAPWAIMPEKLIDIQGVYDTHMKGEKIDINALEARIGEPLQRQEQGYSVENGTAIIPIDGVITRRMNMLQKISGGASTELIERDVKAALEDTNVERILLEIDSPGGSVSGLFELANTIYNARGDKPIDAISIGTMASAAYLIGAAAENVYISGETDSIGSIGVIYTHIDKSAANETAGVKPTEVFAGHYKVITSSNKPLSEEGKGDIQAKVDYIYSLFVEHVAKFRAVSVETVLADMADGRVFIGKQALEAGLVDGVSTVDSLLEAGPGGPGLSIVAESGAGAVDNIQSQTDNKNIKKGELGMDLVQLKAKHPDLVAKIEASSREGYTLQLDVDGMVATAKSEGAEAERERIIALDGLQKPGREDLIKGFKKDGKTTAADAALEIVGYEDQKLAGKLKAITDDAADVNKVPAAESGDGVDSISADSEAPLADRCKAQWDADAKLRDEFVGNFENFLAYAEKDEAGLIRILNQKGDK